MLKVTDQKVTAEHTRTHIFRVQASGPQSTHAPSCDEGQYRPSQPCPDGVFNASAERKKSCSAYPVWFSFVGTPSTDASTRVGLRVSCDGSLHPLLGRSTLGVKRVSTLQYYCQRLFRASVAQRQSVGLGVEKSRVRNSLALFEVSFSQGN